MTGKSNNQPVINIRAFRILIGNFIQYALRNGSEISATICEFCENIVAASDESIHKSHCILFSL